MNRTNWQQTGARLLWSTASLLGLAVAAPGMAVAQPYSYGHAYNQPARPSGPQYVAQAQHRQRANSAPSGLDQIAAGPRHRHNYCPPGYSGGYAAPGYQTPSHPAPGMLPQGGQPSTDGSLSPTPGVAPQQDAGQTPPATLGADTQQNAAAPMTNAQSPLTQNDFSAAQSSSSRASLSPGADTPQLGRNDQLNRLNIFDNMAAAPQTKVWFGFQYSEGFNTGLRPTDGLQSFLSAYPNLSLDSVLSLNEGITSNYFTTNQAVYRVGGEYAVTEHFSVAVQGQYIGTADEDDPSDEWTNPQILFKQVLYRDHDTILSGTLGVTPETHNERGDINERTTKIYPGLLFYEGLSRDWFLQGGVQTGIPTDNNEIDHADWSLALSYWLYRDACPEGEGRCHRPFFLRQFRVTGIVPQINILGKHVIGNNRINGPFGFQAVAGQVVTGFDTQNYILCDPVTGLPVPGPGITITTPVAIPFFLPEGFVIYEEPRSVVDMTVGTTILMGDGIQVGVGYSFPLTDESVRDNELISTISYVF